MRKNNFIGGKNTAKRKTQIREFIACMYKKEQKLSDPFEDSSDSEEIDESEWKMKPLKINYKKNYKLFQNEDEEEDDFSESQPDEILVRAHNLDEADKFIASLKFNPKKKSQTTDYPKLKVESAFSSCDFEAFKKEAERLNTLRNQEINGVSDEDDNII